MSDNTAETFSADNAYTLTVTRTTESTLSSGSSYPLMAVSQLTRSFNFAARQVTTQTRDYIYQLGGYKYGGSGGVSTTLNIQNFDDVQAPDEIIAMHKKLTALGGTPAPIEDIINTLAKPARTLTRGNTP